MSDMTDQPAPEYFDLIAQDGTPLGRAKARAEVHRDGDWHRSANVWIFTGDRRLLWQRRAPDKDTWPGRLDASVGGHYRAGEDGPAAVAREMAEELGLLVDPADLILLGPRRVESLEPGIVDRELQDIFLLRRDAPLGAYTPDSVEIDGLALLDARDAARLHRGEVESVAGECRPRGESTPRPCRFTAADTIIPNRGPYIAAVAQAVDDVLAGRPPRWPALG